MKKGRSLGYLTKEGFRNLWVNRMMSVASIAVLMICLIMMGITFMVLVNVQSVLDIVEEENALSVYLDMDATPDEVQQAKEDILMTQNVIRCEFVSKEQAYKEALEESGLSPESEYFQGIGNPLPDKFIVVIEDESLFNETFTKLENIENVDVVKGSIDIAKTLIEIRSMISYISVAIVLILLFISLFINNYYFIILLYLLIL